MELGSERRGGGHIIVLPRIRDKSCASVESEREGAVVLCEG